VESVQPRIASGGQGKKPEDIVFEMANEIERRVPDRMKAKSAHPETYAKTAEGGIVSLGVFHGQEMTQFNRLAECVRDSCYMLSQAIRGLVVMSAEMEAMFSAFLVQAVPGNWTKLSYPCLKPLDSYVSDLMDRLQFIERWLLNGPPKTFWISALFFPQGFMTASMQMHARSTKIAIDDLKFQTVGKTMVLTDANDCDSDQVHRPEVGVNVHGLFLQGCGWNVEKAFLQESRKGELFVGMPIICLVPTHIRVLAEYRKGLERADYQCPMYKTSERRGVLSTTGHSTNFVMFLEFKYSEKDPAHWTRRGVALLCVLDD
jgi:dynein heavy chain